MLILKELWSSEAFKDLELKDYVDIDDITIKESK